MDKYILLYTDNNEKDIEYLNILKTFNFNIIKLLLNNEDKKGIMIEIYPDQYTEEILIKNSLFILYFSKIIRSKILFNLVKEFKKYIIFKDNLLLENIKTFLNSPTTVLIENFQNIYSNFIYPKKEIFNKNIKINYLKVISNDQKICMITYFKHTTNKMLTILQKKCIIENSKNKNIKKIIVICNELDDEIKEIESNNITFHIIKNNISFKDLFEISNQYYENTIVSILRSDIVLPNQDNLNNIAIDLSENEIYCASKIDRLINGNIIKSIKLNNTFYSTEQDMWIFKTPFMKIDNLLENIFFYDKYSELYLNNILKKNNYNIINNNNYKIIRLMYDNNINNRPLLDNLNTLNKNNIYLLPDNESLNKIPIEQLIGILDNKEIYSLKCDLFNKYYINNPVFFI